MSVLQISQSSWRDDIARSDLPDISKEVVNELVRQIVEKKKKVPVSVFQEIQGEC